jgi:hypothetical protein
MSGSQVVPEEFEELTDKQRRFIEEYPKDCNKAAAARRAGYEPEYARQIGYENYTKPYIRAAIDARLKALAISGDEALKNVSDIATTRLNDYLVVVERERGTTIDQPLAEGIAELDDKIAFEEAYTAEAVAILGLTGKALLKYQASRKDAIDALRLQRLRYRLQLEKDPTATRPIAGPPETYEAVEVDMIALANAQAEGRIKTLSFGEFGPKVEMYDALAANRDILKIEGRFVEKVEHSGNLLTGIQLVDFDGSAVQDL